MPTAVAAATLVSLDKTRREPQRRAHLSALIQRFRRGATELGYTLMASDTPIQPILIGDDGAGLTLSRALAEHGVLVSAIRPPTVPEGQARLRVTLSAAHREADVDRLLGALEDNPCRV